MGWVYPVSDSANEENVWIWKEDAGWLWTSEHTFPYLYSYTSKFWIYLNSQDAGQTKYYDYFDDEWRDWGDFPTRTIVEIEGVRSKESSNQINHPDISQMKLCRS